MPPVIRTARMVPARIRRRIWLAFFWRGCVWMLASLLAAFVVGLLVGIVGQVAGLAQPAILAISRFMGLAAICGGIFWAGKQGFEAVLGRDFDGWCLTVANTREDV